MIVVIVIWISVFVFAIFQMGLDPGRNALSSLAGEWESLSVTLHLPPDKGSEIYFPLSSCSFIISLFLLSSFCNRLFYAFSRKVFASYSNSWACCIKHSWGAALHRKQAGTRGEAYIQKAGDPGNNTPPIFWIFRQICC